MDTNEINYKNFDRLDIYAKKDKKRRIIQCYQSFSWKLVHRQESKRYADTEELTFIRPHKIKNKDFLQYNQIEMENILNDIGKLGKNKHARSTIFGLCFGLLFAGILALGIFLILSHASTLNLAFGISCIGLSSIFLSLTIVITTRTAIKERGSFKQKSLLLNKKLSDVCKIASDKSGDNNE